MSSTYRSATSALAALPPASQLTRGPEILATTEQRLALARCVLAEDLVHFYEGTANHRGGSMDRDLAVLAGVAYFGRVRPEVLAIDADTPDDVVNLLWLAQILREAGFEVVRLSSGGRGAWRQHLFCAMAPEARPAWDLLAHQLGLDVRAFMRPPLTPHRRSTEGPRLIEPATPDEAVAVLSPDALHSADPPPLPVAYVPTAALSLDGSEGAYKGNRSPGAAPPEPGKYMVRRLVRQLRRKIGQLAFEGRGARVQLALLLGLLDMAEAQGTLTPYASYRDLERVTGVSRTTLNDARDALVARGLALVKRNGGHRTLPEIAPAREMPVIAEEPWATVWDLTPLVAITGILDPGSSRPGIGSPPDTGSIPPTELPGGPGGQRGRACYGTDERRAQEDLLADRSLGLTIVELEVLFRLASIPEGWRRGAIAKQLGLSDGSAKRVVERLVGCGLAVRVGCGPATKIQVSGAVSDGDWEAEARRLGAVRASDELREAHEAERTQYRHHLADTFCYRRQRQQEEIRAAATRQHGQRSHHSDHRAASHSRDGDKHFRKGRASMTKALPEPTTMSTTSALNSSGRPCPSRPPSVSRTSLTSRIPTELGAEPRAPPSDGHAPGRSNPVVLHRQGPQDGHGARRPGRQSDGARRSTGRRSSAR